MSCVITLVYNDAVWWRLVQMVCNTVVRGRSTVAFRCLPVTYRPCPPTSVRTR